MEEILEKVYCPVCFELFDTPKCLPCGHSVCASCLSRMQEQPFERAKLHCPKCRAKSDITPGGFATNYELVKLIEDLCGAKVEPGVRLAETCFECAKSTLEERLWRCATCENEHSPNLLCSSCALREHNGHDLVELVEQNQQNAAKSVKQLQANVEVTRNEISAQSCRIFEVCGQICRDFGRLVQGCKELSSRIALDPVDNLSVSKLEAVERNVAKIQNDVGLAQTKLLQELGASAKLCERILGGEFSFVEPEIQQSKCPTVDAKIPAQVNSAAAKSDTKDPPPPKKCWKCDSISCNPKKCKPNVRIVKSELSDTMNDEASKSLVKSFKIAQSETELAREIKNRFEDKFGGFWQAFVKSGGSAGYGYTIRHRPGRYVLLNTGPLYICLFQALQDKRFQGGLCTQCTYGQIVRWCWKCADRDCDGDCKAKEIEIISSVLPPYMETDLKSFALEAVNTAPSKSHVPSKMQTLFSDKYGGHWQCVISSRRALTSSIFYKRNCYAQFRVEALQGLLFKCGSDFAACWKCGLSKCTNDGGNLNCQVGVEQLQVIENSMSEEMTDSAKECVLEAMRRCSNENDVASAVRDTMWQFFGGVWQCLVTGGMNTSLGASLRPQEKLFILMRVNQAHVCIFRSHPELPCWKCGGLLCWHQECILEEPKVVENNFRDENMTLAALSAGLEAVGRATGPNGVARSLTDHFNQVFGGVWQCVVSSVSEVMGTRRNGFDVTHFDDKFIVFMVAKVKIVLFQAESQEPEALIQWFIEYLGCVFLGCSSIF